MISEYHTERFQDGYVFRKADVRGKAFIEYVPAVNAWSPLDADGMNGVVVVTTNKKKPFVSDKNFFLKNGFKVCDTAEPYFELCINPSTSQLLCLSLKTAPEMGGVT